jgi:NO-binding membrane sensor protein with MHYT domain
MGQSTISIRAMASSSLLNYQRLSLSELQSKNNPWSCQSHAGMGMGLWTEAFRWMIATKIESPPGYESAALVENITTIPNLYLFVYAYIYI